jgi:predicted ATPase
MTSGVELDRFVGRDREFGELTNSLDGALAGNGGLVMLVGEPGIGKTRLTEELGRVALERGALVGMGACYDGGSTPPYWAWTQVIRSLLVNPVGFDPESSENESRRNRRDRP